MTSGGRRPAAAPGQARRIAWAAWWRVGCTVVAIVVVQVAVFALALLPIAALWTMLARIEDQLLRAVVYGVVAAPSYVLFAVLLIVVSPLASRLTGARTPENAELRLADLDWPLMRWARAAVATHLVRVVAGSLFRGSPVWGLYFRLAGARVGRRVYVNTVEAGDYNLLEVGDDSVIGADVHLSGHTVEGGVLKTGRVRLGRNVTVGVGSVIGIGVEAGDGAQVGALSFVPKYMRLEAGGVYVGIPVRRLRQALPPNGVRACSGRGKSSHAANSRAPIV